MKQRSRSRKKFKILSRRVVFSKGPIHLVDCRVAMPGGRVLSRQIMEHPGSVVILPRVRPDAYLLVRQFRFAARDWLWELPAGGVELGESLQHAARREMIEETGFRPRHLKKLISFYSSPGVSGEKMHLFLAWNFSPAFARGDDDEEIEIREFSRRQIERMIRNQTIVDAKTITGFFYLQANRTDLS